MATAAAFLPSPFDVSGFAHDAVLAATVAAADLLALRTGTARGVVEVDAVEAAAAFRSEALFEPIGWELPPPWDPIAGDYRTKDRWIRLHTNYATHRRAALSVLGTPAERAAVTAAVSMWDAAALETAVIEAGGCAAAMYTRSEWLAHAHGASVANEPAVRFVERGRAARPLTAAAKAPYAGLRVLDLTRVIAGPVCTRFLAAHGADVLRIDPPGFEEVPALLPETTTGKRCAFLALDTPDGRTRFAELLAAADVLVHGLRPGALARLGFDDATLRRDNPSLLVAALDAYGWTGPWSTRRGFDSLVQMSSGIAAHAGLDRPRPLPAQALDHGAGYLLAEAVGRALVERTMHGTVVDIRASLVGVANALLARPLHDATANAAPVRWPDEVLETARTAWGPARRVRCPGRIDGRAGSWMREAGPLGTAEASWLA